MSKRGHFRLLVAFGLIMLVASLPTGLLAQTLPPSQTPQTPVPVTPTKLPQVTPSKPIVSPSASPDNRTLTVVPKPSLTPSPAVTKPSVTTTPVATKPLVTSTPAATPTPSVIPTRPIQYFSSPPNLTALSAIAVDAKTGRVLYSKSPTTLLPMASTTKIMTALTLFAVPRINLNDFTEIVEDDLVGEASMGLYVGQRLKVIDLLYGLLLDSANDAGMAIARYAGAKLQGEEEPVTKFIDFMNYQAQLLNLENSHFENPHGLDSPEHYSSAEDLAIAGWYALHNPVIAAIVRQSTASLDGYFFYNISNFIRRYPGANGIKPGETENAGLCIVASATRADQTAIIVLLNSPGMRYESDLLMDYAFSQIAINATIKPSPDKPATYIGLPAKNQLLPFKTDFAIALFGAQLEQRLPYMIGNRG